MDTSKTYAKMCNHPLILEQWKPKMGDYTLQRDRLFRPIGEPYVYDGGGFGLLPVRANYCWLPHQGQIQKMINYCSTNFICGIYDWFVKPGGREEEFLSYEQLWMGFYMHEYHKLAWDNKWIREE